MKSVLKHISKKSLALILVVLVVFSSMATMIVAMADPVEPYIVTEDDPVLPLTSGYRVDPADFKVTIGSTTYDGDDFNWALASGVNVTDINIVDGKIEAYERGAYTLSATLKADSSVKMDVYAIVKNESEDSYVIYENDYRDSFFYDSGTGTYVERDYSDEFAITFTDHSGVWCDTPAELDALFDGVSDYVTFDASENFAQESGLGGFSAVDAKGLDAYLKANDTSKTFQKIAYVVVLKNEILENLKNYKFTTTVQEDVIGYGPRGNNNAVLGRIAEHTSTSSSSNQWKNKISQNSSPWHADGDTALIGVTQSTADEFGLQVIGKHYGHLWRSWKVKDNTKDTETGYKIKNLTFPVNNTIFYSSSVPVETIMRTHVISFRDTQMTYGLTTTDQTVTLDTISGSGNVQMYYKGTVGWMFFIREFRTSNEQHFPTHAILDCKVELDSVVTANAANIPLTKIDGVNPAVAKVFDGYKDIGGYTINASTGAITITGPVSKVTVTNADIGSLNKVVATNDATLVGDKFAPIASLDFSAATNLKTFENYAFALANMEELVLPNVAGVELTTDLARANNYTATSGGAFQHASSLRTVDYHGRVLKVGVGAFEGCVSLQSINAIIGSVGQGAFLNCVSLQELTFDAPRIADNACQNNYSLKKVTFSDKLEAISTYAFNRCYALEEVNFQEGLMTIDSQAFSGANSLEVVKFPSTLTEIGYNAFNHYQPDPSKNEYEYSGVKEVWFYNTSATGQSFAADAFPAGVEIHAAKGSYAEAYALANGFTFVEEDIQPPPAPVETYKITKNSPYLALTAGERVKFEDLFVVIEDFNYAGEEITFTTTAAADEVVFDATYASAYKRGVYNAKATATNGDELDFYVVVKNPDEDEYILWEADYRDTSNDDLLAWKTTFYDYNGNLIHQRTGNYAQNFVGGGFAPYNPKTIYTEVPALSSAHNGKDIYVVTSLDNDFVSGLTNYKLISNMRMGQGNHGGVGLAGRITNTTNGVFNAATSNVYSLAISNGYGYVGISYIDGKINSSGSRVSVKAAAKPLYESLYQHAVSTGSYMIRTYELTFVDGKITLSSPDVPESAPGAADNTVSQSIDIKTGTVGFSAMLHRRDDNTVEGQTSHTPAVPVCLDYKVAVAGVSINALPTEAIPGWEETPTTAPVEDFVDNGNYDSTYSKGTLKDLAIKDTNAPLTNKVVVKDVVDGVKTNAIGRYLLRNGEGHTGYALVPLLNQVVLPDGIITIVDSAFNGATFLSAVNIPQNVEKISVAAFASSGITEAIIPHSVTTLSTSSFRLCYNLKKVEIGRGVSSIPETCFERCYWLSNITLPLNVSSIGQNAFGNCTSLKEVRIYNTAAAIDDTAFPTNAFLTIYGGTGSTAEAYATSKDINFVAIDAEIAAAIQAEEDRIAAEEAAKELIINTEDTGATYTIDTTGGIYGIAGFTAGTDLNTGKYTLPKTGVYKGDNVTLTAVLSSAIKNSTDKKRILYAVIPEGYTTIYNSAFSGASEMVKLDLPESLQIIQGNAFASTSSLKEVKIPAAVYEISSEAFKGAASLSKVTFGEDSVLRTIGKAAFEGTKIQTITLPIMAREIGDNAFAGCTALTDVYITNKNAKIGTNAFPAGTKIHGVAGSTAQAYAEANGLTFVADVEDKLSATINSVDANEKVEYKGEGASWKVISYEGKGHNFVIKEVMDHTAADGTVTKGVVVSGIEVNVGKNSKSKHRIYKLTIPETVTTIGDSAFNGCVNLVEVNIPKYVTLIDQYAFVGCDINGKVEVGPICKTIGKRAFYGNANITDVYIYSKDCIINNEAFPEGITIHGYAGSTAEKWARGNNCTFVEITGTPEKISTSTFSDNGNYTLGFDTETGSITSYTIKNAANGYSQKVTIPATVNGKTVTTIADAFGTKPYSASIRAVIIPEGVTTLGESAFAGTSNLLAVQLPSTLTTVGVNAFNGSGILGDIILPETVTTIARAAFANCKGLTSVTITNPEATIGTNAFAEMGAGFTIKGYTGSTAEEYWKKFLKGKGVKFEAIGEYVAPGGDDDNGDDGDGSGDKDTTGTQQNKDDEDDTTDNTIGGINIQDLTIIIIAAFAGLLFLILICGVVIVIVVANSGDDDDDDDDDYDDDDDEEDED